MMANRDDSIVRLTSDGMPSQDEAISNHILMDVADGFLLL